MQRVMRPKAMLTILAPPTRYRFWVLAVLCSLAFLTYLDRICIMRVQGEIERDLEFGRLTQQDESWLRKQGLAGNAQARAKLSRDRSTERMSWVFSAFLFGYMLFGVPVGRLGDRWGARAVIVAVVVWWSVFTALTGSVESMGRLLIRDPAPAIFLAALVL